MKARWWGVITAFAVSVSMPLSAAAQAAFTKPIVPCDGVNCTVCDVATLAQNLLNAGIYFAIFFSAVLFAWGGFKMLTASGNTEQYHQGRSIFTSVAVGLIIILGGWLVVDTLMKTATDGSFGPWNKVCETVLSYFDHLYA